MAEDHRGQLARGFQLLPGGGEADGRSGPWRPPDRGGFGRFSSWWKWQGAYSASKFAVRGLSQSVAQELGEHGITVNVYSPGVVDTPMWLSIDRAITARTGAPVGSAMAGMVEQIALGRLEAPEDVAAVVSFLASPDAGYVTGQSIVVDGGMWFS